MLFSPVKYDEPVFRPPAEAYSAIVQATIGCSWNRCAFCEMYSSKKFRLRSLDDIYSDIGALAQHYGNQVKKVFLGDGNAFVLNAEKLIPILDNIHQSFGRIQRVSAYAMPRDVLSKSQEELNQIRAKGLKLLYIGIETGDDALLTLIHKGETAHSTIEGIKRAHAAGIDTSIMIINGLGGRHYSHQHAVESAKVINAIQPKFLSTLTLSLPYGTEHFARRFQGNYEQQSIVELLRELKEFLEHLEVENVIFRSNHVSNNLELSGTLNRNKKEILEQLDATIAQIPAHIMPSSPGVL